MYKFTITEETLLSIHLAKRHVISGQVVVKGMTYRLDYYEPALLPGKIKTARREAEMSLLFFLVV